MEAKPNIINIRLITAANTGLFIEMSDSMRDFWLSWFFSDIWNT